MKLQRLTNSFLFFLFLIFGTPTHAASGSLLEDDLLLEDDALPVFETETTEASWKDYFVTSLSHEQTRNDQGDTRLLRYSLQLEYEQAFAHGWFARLDVKGTSYRSLDQQAQQHGESYERAKLKAAWLQYSKGSCVHKAGQQSLIWGQVDGTFAVDDITPFDFTEPLLTDYANIRLPQAMWLSECFLGNKKQVQIFYNPRAQLHQSSHNDDEYSLQVLSGIDDEALDDEWGARFKFAISKLEIAVMAANLIANAPTQMLAPPGTPLPPGAPAILPTLSEYSLYGSSFNFTSGAWQLKADVAYKTDQLVENTFNDMSDTVDLAVGIEYLSTTNHNFNAGLWGSYALDNDFVPGQNDSTPFVTLGWNKTYFNDDLNLSLLANGRENPKSISATSQASYQVDDFWNVAGALTLSDVDNNAVNPLQTQDNEINLSVKYQF